MMLSSVWISKAPFIVLGYVYASSLRITLGMKEVHIFVCVCRLYSSMYIRIVTPRDPTDDYRPFSTTLPEVLPANRGR